MHGRIWMFCIFVVLFCEPARTQTITLNSTNEAVGWAAYPRELEIRATTAYLDRFGYQTAIGWTRLAEIDRYEIHAHVASAGKDVMRRSVIYSLRETAANMPIALGWHDWAENLFAGTVGNTIEGDVNTLSPLPSSAEASYWKQMKSDGSLSYGLRPFEGNPYGYIGTQWGHWRGNPAAVTLVRWHYDPIRIASTIDGQISFPLPYGSQLSIGTSFRPERIGSSDLNPGVSIRWVWSFKTVAMDGNCFVGTIIDGDSRIDCGFIIHF